MTAAAPNAPAAPAHIAAAMARSVISASEATIADPTNGRNDWYASG
jgi:hypothetical protein